MSEPASFTHARSIGGLPGTVTDTACLEPAGTNWKAGTLAAHPMTADKYAEGLKFDDGKDPWQLAPWDAFRSIVKVLAFGAKKYEPRNWEKGMAWSRCYAALIRHMTAWWEGEHKDADSGFSHLWCAGCMLCFLIAYELRGIGKDDRPNAP